MNQEQKHDLELLAAKIRLDVLKMLQHRGYGHLGGSLSIVELMSVLYGKQLHIDPKNPKCQIVIEWSYPRDMPVLDGIVYWQKKDILIHLGSIR